MPPVTIDPDPNFFASTQGPRPFVVPPNQSLWVDSKGNLFILSGRYPTQASGGTTISLAVYKVDTSNVITILDSGNNPVQGGGVAPTVFQGFRAGCMNLIWAAYQTSLNGGTSQMTIAVKPFNISTGLWGTTSANSPSFINAGSPNNQASWTITALSDNNTTLLAYLVGQFTGPLNGVFCAGGIWGSSFTIDSTPGGFTGGSWSPWGSQVDKSDTSHFIFIRTLFTGGPATVQLIYFNVTKTGTVSAITVVATYTGSGGFSPSAGNWGPAMYDAAADCIIFPVFYGGAGDAINAFFPQALSAVIIQNASTSPIVSLIGVAGGTGFTGGGSGNPTLTKLPCAFKDGSVYVITMLQNTTSGSPLLFELGVWAVAASNPLAAWSFINNQLSINVATFPNGTNGAPVAASLGFSQGVALAVYGPNNTTVGGSLLAETKFFEASVSGLTNAAAPCQAYAMALALNAKLALSKSGTLPPPPGGGGGGGPVPAGHCVPDLNP